MENNWPVAFEWHGRTAMYSGGKAVVEGGITGSLRWIGGRFDMVTREQVLAYGMTFPDTYVDTPFHDDNWVLIRYKKNKKAFAWTYMYEGTLRVNVKVDPHWRDFWRQAYKAVIPGYHQNKEHWNTLILDGSIPEKEVKRMIAESYDLVVGKT